MIIQQAELESKLLDAKTRKQNMEIYLDKLKRYFQIIMSCDNNTICTNNFQLIQFVDSTHYRIRIFDEERNDWLDWTEMEMPECNIQDIKTAKLYCIPKSRWFLDKIRAQNSPNITKESLDRIKWYEGIVWLLYSPESQAREDARHAREIDELRNELKEQKCDEKTIQSKVEELQKTQHHLSHWFSFRLKSREDGIQLQGWEKYEDSIPLFGAHDDDFTNHIKTLHAIAFSIVHGTKLVTDNMEKDRKLVNNICESLQTTHELPSECNNLPVDYSWKNAQFTPIQAVSTIPAERDRVEQELAKLSIEVKDLEKQMQYTEQERTEIVQKNKAKAKEAKKAKAEAMAEEEQKKSKYSHLCTRLALTKWGIAYGVVCLLSAEDICDMNFFLSLLIAVGVWLILHLVFKLIKHNYRKKNNIVQDE